MFYFFYFYPSTLADVSHIHLTNTDSYGKKTLNVSEKERERKKRTHIFGKINKSTRSLQLRSKAHKIDAQRCLTIAIFCMNSHTGDR